jgi:hypothetical protein
MAGYKKILFTVLIVAYGIIAQAQKSAQILLTNATSFQRDDELVVISRKQLEKKAGALPASAYVVIRAKDNQPVLVQHDDRNGDGVWDEIAFLPSFKPRERMVLKVSFSNAPAAIKADARAHVRHRRKNADNTFGPILEKDSIPAGQPATDFSKQALPPFLTEGPAWENDKVGFRLYLDVRNTKDIWGKTTSQMVLDEVGEDPGKNYHQLANWGMDILKVGKSLGAGGLALHVELPGGKDTLIRLGGVDMGTVQYERIADGPVRAILRLQYPEWKILDGLPPVVVTEEISIWGGQYFYESKVYMKGAPANSKLVTGIVNLKSKQFYKLDTAGHMILYTYDVQSENTDKLGMAIITDKKYVSAIGATPNKDSDVENTFTLSTTLNQETPLLFRFYAGWERSDEQFRSEPGFRKLLTQQAAFIKWPITCLLK